MAYPASGKLFFCTTTEIHPDQELLFDYSRDYCRLLGETVDWILIWTETSGLKSEAVRK